MGPPVPASNRVGPCSTVYYSQQTRTSPPDTLHAPCARVEDSKVRRTDAGCAQDVLCSKGNIFWLPSFTKKNTQYNEIFTYSKNNNLCPGRWFCTPLVCGPVHSELISLPHTHTHTHTHTSEPRRTNTHSHANTDTHVKMHKHTHTTQIHTQIQTQMHKQARAHTLASSSLYFIFRPCSVENTQTHQFLFHCHT